MIDHRPITMFRPEESYDMPDPFDPYEVRRPKAADYINIDAMVGKFELAQPKAPQKNLTHRDVGVALHQLAKECGVLGTVYERRTKVWSRGNCRCEEKMTLPVAIHGTAVAIGDFLQGMTTRVAALDKLIIRGSVKVRTMATYGGKPGDVIGSPGSLRYTKFGRRPTDTKGKGK